MWYIGLYLSLPQVEMKSMENFDLSQGMYLDEQFKMIFFYCCISNQVVFMNGLN
jgi:hypothetical protein